MKIKIYQLLSVALFILIVSITVSYFYYPLVDPDSGYYLSIAREFYNGKIYFKEITTIYNPLAIIILGLPYLFYDDVSIGPSLVINFIFLISNAVIIYKIVGKIEDHKEKKIFFSLFYFAIILMLDGSCIMLEPISVFFQLTSLLMYIYFKQSQNLRFLFFAGLCAGFSFIAKQYGIFIVFAITIDLLMVYKNKIKNIFIIGISTFLPVMPVFLYLLYYDCSVIECFKFILGKGVFIEIGNGTGSNYTIFSYCLGFLITAGYNLYLIFIPIYIIKNKHLLDKNSYIYLFSFLSSLVILIFASYVHYFQYVVPYLLILFIYLQKNAKYAIHNKLILCSYLLSIFIITGVATNSFLRKELKYIQQEKSKKIIEQFIPEKSQVFIDGISPAFYLINNFRSINLSRIGYSFAAFFYPATIVKNTKQDSYIILNKQSLDKYKSFTELFQIKKAIINEEAIYICQKK